jgi:hypothetical protein
VVRPALRQAELRSMTCWQRLHEEVSGAHARLHRAKGVLDRLAPLTHGLRIRVEATLLVY